MALFSRRKKSDAVAEPAASEEEASPSAGESVPEESSEATTPSVDDAATEVLPEGFEISVGAFRGVGAPAGPSLGDTVADPSDSVAPGAPAAIPGSVTPAPKPQERVLPLAPLDPPEQTETVAGMKDNVLLREALAQLTGDPSNEQLLGVLRQALQSHLYLRVHGDAREQLSAGQPLAIGVLNDGDRRFVLAYSSAGSLRDAVEKESNPEQTSAMAQPVQNVFQQVVSGDFTGIIIDNSSAPHRVVFPKEIIARALDQADTDFRVKNLLAAPRDADSEAKVAEALAEARLWVAVSDAQNEGQFGIAEAQMADGSRYLQVFTHPLEIVALGRQERPMPFTGEMIGRVLAGHPEHKGVIVDAAGPGMVVNRAALETLIERAVAAQQAEGIQDGVAPGDGTPGSHRH